MNIKEDSVNGQTVLHISGRADNTTSDDFREAITPYLEVDKPNLVLNLEALEYVSSAGLRVFLKVAKDVKAKDGDVVICGMGDLIQEVFEISGFISLFEISDTLENALA